MLLPNQQQPPLQQHWCLNSFPTCSRQTPPAQHIHLRLVPAQLHTIKHMMYPTAAFSSPHTPYHSLPQPLSPSCLCCQVTHPHSSVLRLSGCRTARQSTAHVVCMYASDTPHLCSARRRSTSLAPTHKRVTHSCDGSKPLCTPVHPLDMSRRGMNRSDNTLPSRRGAIQYLKLLRFATIGTPLQP